MSIDLIIHRPAQDDIDEQAAFLDDHDTGSGERFLAEVHRVYERLVTFPGFGHPFPTPLRPNLRCVVLPTFPLSVFYEPSPTAIDVYRVLHHARELAGILDKL